MQVGIRKGEAVDNVFGDTFDGEKATLGEQVGSSAHGDEQTSHSATRWLKLYI